MDCRTFQEMLLRYLGGNLPADEFDRMVDHEAECAACRALAAAKMSAPDANQHAARLREIEAAWAFQDRLAQKPPAAATGGDWMAATLDRTVGSDCNYISMRLAEALDTAPAPDTAERVDHHVDGCFACRALAETMRRLPEYYATLPRLHADQAFAREIIARTMPARLNWLEVLRALVRRPEALWEGAVVCALLAAPLVGPSMTSWIQSARNAGTQVEQSVTAADPLSAAARRIAVAGESVRLSIAGSRQSIVDSWSRARARVEQSFTDEINKRAASDPRVAVVVPLFKDALGRIGLIDDGQPTRTDETAPEQAQPVPDPGGPAEHSTPPGSSVTPGQEQTEVNPDELR